MFKAEDIGKGNRLKFKGDNTTYYSKNKDASLKFIFVTKEGSDQVWRKPIANIVQLDNKKLNEEVSRLQQLAGINEIKINNPNQLMIDKILNIWFTKTTTEIPGNLLRKYYKQYFPEGPGVPMDIKFLLSKMSSSELQNLYNVMEEY